MRAVYYAKKPNAYLGVTFNGLFAFLTHVSKQAVIALNTVRIVFFHGIPPSAKGVHTVVAIGMITCHFLFLLNTSRKKTATTNI